MKSRRQIYDDITEELLRCVRTYRFILPEQACRLFPQYEAGFVKNVITRLNYKREIKIDRQAGCITEPLYLGKIDRQMINALWVLLAHKVENGSHTAGDYPVKISFVENGMLYDIVTVACGEELPVSLALGKRKGEKPPCIVVLNHMEQAKEMTCPKGTMFCTIADDGRIIYCDGKGELLEST